jgi:hypothetical protein
MRVSLPYNGLGRSSLKPIGCLLWGILLKPPNRSIVTLI